ncbi:hypothetical protein [Kitasatospora sp. SUK 42]|uniref:hypothetical protein n=1 Tax=Kitasatospora sp. SUK 42 TaxID=1588882 RepID=UPI0018CA4424|nr:hypothetical protein [Kitasatospora sp. SUK 42]MBV2153683.1 hypothetical protein [Kitasatospora sp. SUK 42]
MVMTSTPERRLLKKQIRGGLTGALTGSLFGGLWYLLGLSSLSGLPFTLALVGGCLLLGIALLSMLNMARLAIRAPEQALGDPVPKRDGRFGFTSILIAESIALGAGNTYLQNTLHRPEWMLTWSALVVGVHFLPLASTMGVPMLRRVGAAMIAVAVATPLVVGLGAQESLWQALPGLGCAAILWGSAVVTGERNRKLANH